MMKTPRNNYGGFSYNNGNHNTIAIMKAVKTFRGAINRLNKIPNINYGGCAISALALYKWLKLHGQLTSKTCIVYLHDSYDKSSYVNNLNVLRKGIGKPKSCCHAALLHKGKIYDSTGCISDNLFKYAHIHKINNIDFVINSINNVGEWNYCFNRLEQLPTIEALLNIDLLEVVTYNW